MRWYIHHRPVCVEKGIHQRLMRQNPEKSAIYASRCLLHDLSVEHLTIPQSMRRYNNASQIISWDPRHSHHSPHFQDNTIRCTYLRRKLSIKIFCQSLSYSSPLPRLHVIRQRGRTFRHLRGYRATIIPASLIKLRDTCSAFHVLRRPRRNYALKSLHYSSKGISFKLYHCFHYSVNCLVILLILTLDTMTICRLEQSATNCVFDTSHCLKDAYKFSIVLYNALPFISTSTSLGLQVVPHTLAPLVDTHIIQFW